MTTTDSAPGYTARQISDVVGVPKRQVSSMVRDGLLTPARDASNRLRFSFRDIVLLRTAKELRTAGVSSRRLRRALVQLQQRLPVGVALSEIGIEAAGGRVVVRDSEGVFEVESGQIELELGGRDDAHEEPVDEAPSLTLAPAARPPAPVREEDDAAREADELYNLGIDLESVSSAQAQDAYEKALALRPEHADARANLGRLLHQQGRIDEAEREYRKALEHEPDNVTAAFNHGVALEDLGRPDAAIAAYERALRSDPTYAAAHFNLARLFEREGRRDAALRHLAGYRQATRD